MITRIIELSCDHTGCETAYAPNPQELTSLQLTRVGSAVAGWTLAEGKDYCPEHRPAGIVDRIRELAAKRLTDGQIASRLGLARATVQKYRSDNGIPAGLGRVGRPSSGFKPASHTPREPRAGVGGIAPRPAGQAGRAGTGGES